MVEQADDRQRWQLLQQQRIFEQQQWQRGIGKELAWTLCGKLKQ